MIFEQSLIPDSNMGVLCVLRAKYLHYSGGWMKHKIQFWYYFYMVKWQKLLAR